jgi:hypothetical protein
MLHAVAMDREYEQGRVQELGERLFYDRLGTAQKYPTARPHVAAPYIPVAQEPGDPYLPCRLVDRLRIHGRRLSLAS